MARVVIRDVAAAAGVSRATVSNYLNRPDVLSATTKARIERAIEELGFVPNDAARQVKLGVNRNIGYVAFEVSNAYFGEVADAIEARAQDAGFTVMIGNSSGSVAREREYLDLFERQRVGGIIVAPLGDVEDQLDQMRRRGTPSVMTGRLAQHADQASVSVADMRGGQLAAGHLLSTGRRRIAFVGGSLDVRQVSDRLLGAERAVREQAGASLEVFGIEERSVAAGFHAGSVLAARDPATRPDGIFAVNDLVAFGVVQALVTTPGVRVPHDVAVIGYDDFDIDASAAIPLSSIRTPHETIGHTAFDLLLYQMGRGTRVFDERHLVFEPSLVARASTIG